MKSIFISYSHKDKEWKNRVVDHLSVLEEEKLIKILDDQKTDVGKDWQPEIEKYLNEANAAILLISTNFLNSDFIRDIEMPTILKKREDKSLHVIPLLIKPCAWEKVNWLKQIELRPKYGKSLSTLEPSKIDAELTTFVLEVERLLNKSSPVDKPDELEKIKPEYSSLTLIDLYKYIEKNIMGVDLNNVVIAVIHSNLFPPKILEEVLQFFNERGIKCECPSLNVNPFGYSDAIESAINNTTQVLYLSLKSEEHDSGWRKFTANIAEDACKEIIYYTF